MATDIFISQFKELIVRPTLKALCFTEHKKMPDGKESAITHHFDTESAVNLLTATALVESNLSGLKQINGPALGFYQIEPATANDCWLNFLLDRPAFVDSVYFASGFPQSEVSQRNRVKAPTVNNLMTNLAYATCMARVIYYRIPESLPVMTDDEEQDSESLYWYYKKYYNTDKGKANIVRDLPLFRQTIMS